MIAPSQTQIPILGHVHPDSGDRKQEGSEAEAKPSQTKQGLSPACTYEAYDLGRVTEILGSSVPPLLHKDDDPGLQPVLAQQRCLQHLTEEAAAGIHEMLQALAIPRQGLPRQAEATADSNPSSWTVRAAVPGLTMHL